MQQFPLWRVKLLSLIYFTLVHKLIRVSGISSHPIVVVIGFDGFRFDYMNRGWTPTLEKFAKEGVSTDYLQNVFPTKTMTNFFSIATGTYAETHGVLGNQVFNSNLKCLSYCDELFHYNPDITPIWILNEITGSGRHSAGIMWSAIEFDFRGHKPTFYKAYNRKVRWHERVNTTLQWLLDDQKPANLVMMYFEQPDSVGHSYGIDSNEMNDQLIRVDNIFRYFLEQLAIHHLEDKVNVIVLSDHGMVNVDRSRLANVTEIISSFNAKKCNSSPLLQIAANPEIKEQLYESLVSLQNESQLFDVYKREEIPERWHYKNNARHTDLFLAAKLFYAFDDEKGIGEHGYDNVEPEMHAFFAAKGPYFRTNYHVDSLNNIDIYALISYILELDPSHLRVKPNGTLSDIITTLNSNLVLDFKKPSKRRLLEYFIPQISKRPSLHSSNKSRC